MENNHIIDLMKKKKENEAYLKSPEWKERLERAKNAENDSYTIIYRDADDQLKEAWHWLSEYNIEDVKEDYKKLGRDIVRFVKKEKPFGEYLASIKGASK